MKNQPLVSVIIPLYNNEKYIEDALNSVFAQDYSNLEVIVVNDGSTDNSVAALDKFLDRIILINQENAGVSAARNTGIERSIGKYVAFLDSDDIWLQGKITAQVAFMEENPDFGAIHSNYIEWDISKRGYLNFDLIKPAKEFFSSGWVLKSLALDNFIHTTSIMIRRKCFIKIKKFDTKFVIGEDVDLWFRLAAKFKIHKILNIYSVYRINEDSITFSVNRTNNIFTTLNKLLETLTEEDLFNNNITITYIKKCMSNACIDMAYYYLGKNLIIKSLKELCLAFQYDRKNRSFYNFLWRHFWKYFPKAFRNIYWKTNEVILKQYVKLISN